MAVRPDNLLEDNTITMNKLELSKQEQEQNITVEDIRSMRDKSIKDMSNWALSHIPSSKKGITMNKVRLFDFLNNIVQTDEKFVQKSIDNRLREISGINRELTDEEKQSIIEQNVGDKLLTRYLNSLEDLKKKDSNMTKKLQVYRDTYNSLDEERLELLDNIDDKLLRNTGLFTSSVLEGFTDLHELAKNMAINAVTGGIATQYGLGPLANKTLNWTVDGLDNYYSMMNEDRLINGEEGTLTKQDLVYGTLASLAGQEVIGGVSGLIKKFKQVYKGEVGKTMDIAVDKTNQAKSNESGIPKNDTSIKDIIREDYNLVNGEMSAEKKIFKKKMTDNPNIKYQQQLDPNNPRIDVYDTLNDYKLETDNPNIIYKENNGHVSKNTVSSTEADIIKQKYATGEISEEQFNIQHTKAIEDAKVKSEIGISVDEDVKVEKEKLNIIKRKKPIKVANEPKKDIDILSEEAKPYIEVDTKQNYKEMFGGDFKVGDVRVLENDTSKIIAYVDEAGNIIKQTIDKSIESATYKQDPSIIKEHYAVRQLKKIKDSRIEIITDDGIKSIIGMQKVAYWGKLRTIERLNRLIPNVKIFVERTAKNIYDNPTGEMKAKGLETNAGMINILDDIIMKPIENVSNAIKNHNLNIFKELMGNYYKSVDEMLVDCDDGALAEIFVKGSTNKKVFKTPTIDGTDDIRLENLNKWVSGLVDNNTFYYAYKTQANITDLNNLSAEDLATKYGKIFMTTKDGDIQYNTGKGGMFEGLNQREIEAKILDLEMNPEKIDLGLEKNIPDRDTYDEIFKEVVTIDRQNGMALDQVFHNYKKLNKILRELGFYSNDIGGEITSSIEAFSNGLGRLVGEISDPESKYNKEDLHKIVNMFYDFSKLPKRLVMENGKVKGQVATNLLDFVIKNRDNGYLDIKELHNLMSPHMEILSVILERKTNDINKRLQNQKYSLNIDKGEYDNLNKVLNILNRWKGVSEKKKGTNAYLETEKFKKEYKEVQDLLQKVNAQVDISSIDEIKPKVYSGNITFENIIDNFENAFDGISQMVDKYSTLKNAKEKVSTIIGKKRNIKGLVETDTYKQAKDELIKILKEVGYPEEELSKLDSQDKKVLQAIFKDIEDLTSNKLKKGSDFMSSLDDLSELSTPEKIQSYIKKIRNRNKLNYLIDTMKEYGADEKLVNDMLDFISYNAKDYDYKLDKKSIITTLDDAINSISKLSQDLDVKQYGKRRASYKQLQDKYKSLSSIIRVGSSEKSLNIIKNKDIEKIFDDIVSLSKNIGDDPIDIMAYKEILLSLQSLQKNIIDVQKNSPMKQLQNSFVSKFRKYTSNDKQKYGRLEAVIEKHRWLSDKGYYNQTDETNIMKVLFNNYNTLDDIPEGTAEKYIAPEFITKFKNLYEYAVDMFRGYEVYDSDGTIMTSRPLTIDEFAVVYAHFLDELSLTTRPNKVISDNATSIGALKHFFKDEDDMIKFFTNRKEMYGAGYVKTNGDMVFKFNEKMSRDLAEVNVLGTSLMSFANKLSLNNQLYKNVEKKHFISDTVDGVTITKDRDKVLDSNVLSAMNKMLRTTREKNTPYNDLGSFLDENWNSFIGKAINFLYPILLNTTGIGEVVFNHQFISNRTTFRDRFGRSFGYGKAITKSGDIKNKTLNLYANNIVKGFQSGAGGVVAGVVNGSLGLYNMAMTLDKYFFASNFINRTFDKDVDPRIKIGKLENILPFIARLSGVDKVAIQGCLDDYTSKKLIKGKHYYDKPKELQFKGNSWNYIKKGFAEAWDVFTEHALAVQEVSDMSRSIISNIKAKDLMEELSVTPYNTLPEVMISTLRRFGIDETNYSQFIENLNLLKTDGEFNIYLRDLIGQIPNNQTLKDMDIRWVESIQELTNHFYNRGFDLDPTFKYSQKANSAIDKINMALRHTTAGIAIGDIKRIGYDETSYGTVEAKYKRLKRKDQDTSSVIGNSIINGAKTIPAFVLSSILLGQGANLLDDIIRTPENLLIDVSQSLAETQVIIDNFQDEKYKTKFIDNFLYLCSLTPKYLAQSVPIGSIFSQSNIFDVYKQYGGEFYKAIQMMLNSPHEVDTQKLNQTLSDLGIDTRYDKIEHMDKGRIIPMLSLMGTLAVQNTAKTPAGLYNLYKKGEDYNALSSEVTKLERYNRNEDVGRNASNIYTQLLNMGNKPEDIANVMLPIPTWDELSNEGKQAIGESLFDAYATQVVQLSDNIKSNSVEGIDVMNNLYYTRGLIDEDEFNARQKKLYNSMELDKEVDALPIQYKMAIDDIIYSYVDPSKLEVKKIQLAALNLIKNVDNIKPQELISQLANNPQEILSYKETKIKPRYNTFDELPYIYKNQYEDIISNGSNITEDDFLSQINNQVNKR